MRENKTAAQQPNLILTGFMGTGKSSVGRLLAHLWRRPFLDTDKEIERRTHRKIKNIFAEDGEPFFRELEIRCVDEWLPESGAIIATGGGILTSKGMREKLRARGVVITLFASPETIYARTRNGNRPLLQTDDPTAKIRELLTAREQEIERLKAGSRVAKIRELLAAREQEIERLEAGSRVAKIRELLAAREQEIERLEAGSRTAKIRELLAAREQDYLHAGIGIYTDGRTMLDLAQNIARIYRREIRSR